MKRGMRPIAHARDEAVLERIDIAVFDVARIISLVTNQVLPEPPLPNAAFVARNANGTALLPLWQCPRETALDQPPAGGKVVITGR